MGSRKGSGNLLLHLGKMVKRLCCGIKNYAQYFISLVLIAKISRKVQKKKARNEALNVVFIVQYIPGWSKLRPIYLRMKESKQFNPTIVCVPLNIQNNTLQNGDKNDTYEYFIGSDYDAVNALTADGSWFELKQLKPDYVFHSRPYNDFMPKCYSSKIIRKYALICNVLYGANLSQNEQDVSINKDYYRDVYCYFAFDKSEKQFYERRFSLGCKLGIQKCWPYGAIGLEQVLQLKREKDPSDFRKTVLWTPRWSTDPYIGGSNFFHYKDTILRLAKENTDIQFIIRPHPLMFGNFVKTGEMSEAEVAVFKEYCAQEQNVQLDESKEYIEKFWNSDILITDLSGIVPEYFVTGKPILYCHSNAAFVYTQYASDMIRSCYEVHNENDLTGFFHELVHNRDCRFGERKECLDQYFMDLQNNSRRIIDLLAQKQ